MLPKAIGLAMNYIDKAFFANKFLFFFLYHLILSPSSYIIKWTCASHMSAVKLAFNYRRNQSHKTELCFQLTFWSSRCVPKADCMGIMKVNSSPFWTVESFCFYAHLRKDKLKALLGTDANTVCLMQAFWHDLLLNSFANSFKKKQDKASDWSHLNFCFSEVTGVPVSLVGYSLALNGLIFRRVLSNFWKSYSLSRNQKLDPEILTYPFLKAGQNKKGEDKSQSVGILLLITNGCCIRLNIPITNECWYQEECTSFHKRNREYLCLKE